MKNTIIIIIIIIILLCIMIAIGLVRSWSATYKIAYYERWLERLRDEGGIAIGTAFDSVKNDFWKFLK